MFPSSMLGSPWELCLLVRLLNLGIRPMDAAYTGSPPVRHTRFPHLGLEVLVGRDGTAFLLYSIAPSQAQVCRTKPNSVPSFAP